MATLLCPACGQGNCNHMVAPGPLTPVKIVCSDLPFEATINGDVTVDTTDTEIVLLCDDNGSFIRKFYFDQDSNLLAVQNLSLAGTNYTPVGEVHSCSHANQRIELCLCDDVNNDGTEVVTFKRIVEIDSLGDIEVIGDYKDDYSGEYNPSHVKLCDDIGSDAEIHTVQLCDDNGVFWRMVDLHSQTIVYQFDATGQAYTPTGTIGACDDLAMQPLHTIVLELCDDDGTKFKRIVAVFANGDTEIIGDYEWDLSANYLANNIVECEEQVNTSYTDTICMCDNINGDGSLIEKFTRLISINTDGNILVLGDYTPGFTAEYTPISPIFCEELGVDAELYTLQLCDELGTFWRVVDVQNGIIIRTFDENGQSYTPVGTIETNCASIVLDTTTQHIPYIIRLNENETWDVNMLPANIDVVNIDLQIFNGDAAITLPDNTQVNVPSGYKVNFSIENGFIDSLLAVTTNDHCIAMISMLLRII